MAATVLQQYQLGQDVLFRQRVAACAVSAAIAVCAEVVTIAQHVERLAYAQKVLADPDTQAIALALGCATNATLATEYASSAPAASGNILDSDLQFTVNSLFTAYAGGV